MPTGEILGQLKISPAGRNDRQMYAKGETVRHANGRNLGAAKDFSRWSK
jgi:hypothetical protein